MSQKKPDMALFHKPFMVMTCLMRSCLIQDANCHTANYYLSVVSVS